MVVPAFGRLDSLDPESVRLAMAQFGYCLEVMARHQQRSDRRAYARALLGREATALH